MHGLQHERACGWPAWGARLRSALELRLLAPAWLAASAVWLFLWLGHEVGEGSTHPLDARWMLLLRDAAHPERLLGPPGLQDFARDVTALGSPGVLTALVVAVAGFLMLAGRRRVALAVALSCGGGALMSTLLKLWYARPRPDLVPHAVHVANASFPSGHAMGSAVVYLTLAALVAHTLPTRALKGYVLGCAALLSVAIGVSRVYLGVHWPSDVLAGWAAGLGWALLCWLVARRWT